MNLPFEPLQEHPVTRAGKEPAEDVKRAFGRAIRSAGLLVQGVQISAPLNKVEQVVKLIAAGKPVTFADGLSLQQWQEKKGQDKHSIIADPLFVDPGKDDFRLKPESPALRLGFQQTDMDQIGLEIADTGGIIRRERIQNERLLPPTR